MYCICCKKNSVFPSPSKLEYSTAKNEEDVLWKNERRPDGSFVNVNNEMVEDGIIHIIDAGYGSKHDGDQFVIAICDDCIKECLQDATILYWGNYMYNLAEFTQEKIKKSKQKYRRRKNLDDIVI